MDPREETSDVFIAHASEDKDTVARPLATALIDHGWTVWMDELRLTVGDSLSRRIDNALSHARFGVVILSPAFFSKEWPQRELAGLGARELDTGDKVILPVWHDVDHSYIVQRSPVLADRLGTSTSAGIENVASELARALEASSSVDRNVPPGELRLEDTAGEDLFAIPTTKDEQDALIRERPDWWEYRLYAGVLVQGRLELEDKWQHHQLRLAGGSRNVIPEDGVSDFLSRELGWMGRQSDALNRVFDPEVLENAFGACGQEGDPVMIKSVASGVIHIYGSIMDWAASLRNSSVPSDYEQILELVARMVDGPVRQIHDFTQTVADEIARVPILLREAEAGGATTDSPMTVTLTLTLSIDDRTQSELDEEFERLRRLHGD